MCKSDAGKDLKLGVQELRVLSALAGGAAVSKARLQEAAGFSPLTGAVTRAMNGIPEGSSSGAPRPGLARLGLAEVVRVDLDGVEEMLIRITPTGQRFWAGWLAAGGKLPPPRDKGSCVNRRYRGNSRDRS